MADWWVYIIEATDGRYYTGITTDVERRFEEHLKNRAKGARFFRGNAPKYIRYRADFDSRSSASKEEARIKKLTRMQKRELMQAAD